MTAERSPDRAARNPFWATDVVESPHADRFLIAIGDGNPVCAGI